MKSQNRCSNPNGVQFCHHPTHPTLGRQISHTFGCSGRVHHSQLSTREEPANDLSVIKNTQIKWTAAYLICLGGIFFKMSQKKLTLQLLFILSGIQRQILVEGINSLISVVISSKFVSKKPRLQLPTYSVWYTEENFGGGN